MVTGGSCFPKDIQVLIYSAEEHGYNSEMLKAVEAVNRSQKTKLYEYICDFYKLEKSHKIGLQEKTFAVWGLSFKPNTNDMRDAPSRVLLDALLNAGATVKAFDPKAQLEAEKIYGDKENLLLVDSKEEALVDANALVICTEWQEFKAVDLTLFARNLKDLAVFDGRNLYEPDQMYENGLFYRCVGR